MGKGNVARNVLKGYGLVGKIFVGLWKYGRWVILAAIVLGLLWGAVSLIMWEPVLFGIVFGVAGAFGLAVGLSVLHDWAVKTAAKADYDELLEEYMAKHNGKTPPRDSYDGTYKFHLAPRDY